MCMTLTNGNFLGQRLIGYDFYDSKSKGFVGMSEKQVIDKLKRGEKVNGFILVSSEDGDSLSLDAEGFNMTNLQLKSGVNNLSWLNENSDCDGYIFLWSDGREYDPDYITKLFKKAVTRCPNVPHDVTLHGLRHSCCAILFQQGYDLAQVQAWLGHSDIAVTANIYNHVSKKWKNEQGRKYDGLFQ